MRAVTYIEMTREEAISRLPYRLINECICSSKWKTGSVQRKYEESFSEEERLIINTIMRKSNRYYNVGIPDKDIFIPVTEYTLWICFADFLHKTFGGN